MEISLLITELNKSKTLPVDAIRELMKRKSESTPVLLGVLESTLDDYKRMYEDRIDYIFAFYILSYFREPLAFEYVIKCSHLPSNWIEKVLGDHVTEGLSSWIVSTFDGNIEAIKNVIENETAFTYVRSAALNSLIGLFAIGVLTRKEVLGYCKQLMRSHFVKDYEFATSVVLCVHDLYPEELYTEIMDLYEKNLVATWYLSKDDIERSLCIGKDQCLQENVYSYQYYLPITDVLDRVSWVNYEQDEDVTPNVPKRGRNESCYCGSDKKYKKCCLYIDILS